MEAGHTKRDEADIAFDCRIRLWQIPSSFTGESTGEDVDVIEVCAQPRCDFLVEHIYCNII